jgi:hypothetical protein
MDIVLQGPIWPTTLQTAVYYLELPFVEKIIISTWEDEDIEDSNIPNIKIIKSTKPPFKPSATGLNTIDYQILSSFEGIKLTTSNIIAKMRTDQIVHLDDMVMMNEFALNNINDTDLLYADGTKRKGNVYVLGLNKIHPFHPQDHIFWGYREDIYKIFDIPFKPEYLTNEPGAFRDPAYIGAMYFKQFYPEVELYLTNFREYMIDNPPKLDAKILSEKTRDKVFKIFPKIYMEWPKYNCNYPYEMYIGEGEYYYEDLI